MSRRTAQGAEDPRSINGYPQRAVRTMNKRILLQVIPVLFIVIFLVGMALLLIFHQPPTTNNVFSNIAEGFGP